MKEVKMNRGGEVIAVDLGGTNMRVALVRNYKIVKYIKKNTPKEKKNLIHELEESISQLMSKKIKGIGVGVAGPVKNGIVRNAPNIPMKNFDLKKHLAKKFGKRVEVGNDTGCFALAELRLGLKSKNFILLTFGTGIGGGIVINGNEYRGTGYGAEFGHMYIRGVEWESLWKKTREKIRREFKEQKLIKDLVKIGNKKSREILDETADYIGEGIASLISDFDPEVVLIGGGVREAGGVFLKLINEKTRKYTFIPKKTTVRWTTLKHPGILGASLLI